MNSNLHNSYKGFTLPLTPSLPEGGGIKIKRIKGGGIEIDGIKIKGIFYFLK